MLLILFGSQGCIRSMTCTYFINLDLHPEALCYDASQASQALHHHPLLVLLGAYRSFGESVHSSKTSSRCIYMVHYCNVTSSEGVSLPHSAACSPCSDTTFISLVIS